MKTIPLNARSKAILTRIGTKKTFSPAQTIYWQQDFGNTFFYIQKGRVRAFLLHASGKELTYEIVGEGRLVGMTDPLLESIRTTSIEAVTQVELIELKIDDLLRCPQESGELAIEIIRLLSYSVEALARHVRRLTFLNAPERIADFLLEISEDPHPSLEVANDTIPYSHQESAECCALQRVTVTRALKALEARGLIELGYRRITIKDRTTLEKFARSSL